jgi:hypothetical protein|tara:strand:- start:2175 stop:2765 length:591 start_codon:yes stop_codon:yes gene_type:complete
MQNTERNLTKENIDKILEDYAATVEEIGHSVQGQKGHALLASIKRDKIDVGPYPHVTLFEAANRIMTDLVILHGVKWLLGNEIFPFDSYTVEFGNENKNDFDLYASNNEGNKLIGEAFNVAQSFFQGKKSAMLKKLRKDDALADYKVVMVNHDAVSPSYSPKGNDIYYVIVNVSDSCAKVLPNKSKHSDAASSAGV